MSLINFALLKENQEKFNKTFQNQQPFRYIIFENFFNPEAAEKIYSEYPEIEDGQWDGKTYINQKNKFQKTEFEDNSLFKEVFKELNSPEFLAFLQSMTAFDEELLPDEKLFGGGLHQSINGAFLNVHVDYNIHPETKFHRRLNVLIYMNKNWKKDYGGYLELWDLRKEPGILLQEIEPSFNRCVIFETNEISFHGHPKKLNTPPEINRKSIATYYYTKTRPADEIANEHNTIYINTEGVSGQIKKFTSGVKALLERINNK